MKSHYLKMDFYRCFFSAQMILAVLGVCAVHIFIPQQFIEPRVSVLRSFNVAWSSNAMVLAYIFTTLAYGPVSYTHLDVYKRQILKNSLQES